MNLQNWLDYQDNHNIDRPSSQPTWPHHIGWGWGGFQGGRWRCLGPSFACNQPRSEAALEMLITKTTKYFTSSFLRIQSSLECKNSYNKVVYINKNFKSTWDQSSELTSSDGGRQLDLSTWTVWDCWRFGVRQIGRQYWQQSGLDGATKLYWA